MLHLTESCTEIDDLFCLWKRLKTFESKLNDQTSKIVENPIDFFKYYFIYFGESIMTLPKQSFGD